MGNNEREALAAQTLAGIEKLEKMLTYERRDYSDVDAVNARAVEQMAAVGAPELVEKLMSTGRTIAARTQENEIRAALTGTNT